MNIEQANVYNILRVCGSVRSYCLPACCHTERKRALAFSVSVRVFPTVNHSVCAWSHGVGFFVLFVSNCWVLSVVECVWKHAATVYTTYNFNRVRALLLLLLLLLLRLPLFGFGFVCLSAVRFGWLANMLCLWYAKYDVFSHLLALRLFECVGVFGTSFSTDFFLFEQIKQKQKYMHHYTNGRADRFSTFNDNWNVWHLILRMQFKVKQVICAICAIRVITKRES